MFIVTQSSAYKWPVKVQIAVDGGRFNEQTFDAEFKRLSQTEIEAFRASVASDTYSPKDIAKQVVAGWSGVQDANGDIPFSDSALNSVLDIPGVAASIVIAYFDSVNGVTRKN